MSTFWSGFQAEIIFNLINILGDEASARVVQWIEDREQEGELSNDDRIMDVGCGNGMLCVDLHKAGFTQITGNLNLR